MRLCPWLPARVSLRYNGPGRTTVVPASIARNRSFPVEPFISKVVQMDGETHTSSTEREREKTWITEFLAGDRSAFDRLVLRYQDNVFNLCCRMLGDRQDADDCAQEVFVKAYRSLDRFRFDSAFSTWLYSIAVNTCRNYLKSAAFRFRRKIVRLDATDGTEGSDGLSDVADPGPSALAQMEQRERELLVQKAVSALPRDVREVIVLRDIEGLPYEDIARITGYNPGTVKSKLSRARGRIRDALKIVLSPRT